MSLYPAAKAWGSIFMVCDFQNCVSARSKCFERIFLPHIPLSYLNANEDGVKLNASHVRDVEDEIYNGRSRRRVVTEKCDDRERL